MRSDGRHLAMAPAWLTGSDHSKYTAVPVLTFKGKLFFFRRARCDGVECCFVQSTTGFPELWSKCEQYVTEVRGTERRQVPSPDQLGVPIV